MTTRNIAATEYRNLPLAVLTESATNPRRIFEDSALKELAESIRSQGVLSPLLVRPLNDHSFEIVAGARRYRAAQMAEVGNCARPHRQPHRRRGIGGAANRKPATPRRSPAGGSAGIPRPAQSGRAEIQHRADRGEDGKIACICALSASS